MPRVDRANDADRQTACPRCGGTGMVVEAHPSETDPSEIVERRVRCPVCGGYGRAGRSGGSSSIGASRAQERAEADSRASRARES